MHDSTERLGSKSAKGRFEKIEATRRIFFLRVRDAESVLAGKDIFPVCRGGGRKS